jgi:hypothetical protein
MTLSKRKKAFYALLSAGLAFIFVGTISAIYNAIPVEVSIDNTIPPGKIDILTPNMDTGNTANIKIAGSTFNVTIADPNKKIVKSENDITNFHYNFVAQKDGEHTITVRNTGDSKLYIEGTAYTKGNPIAFTGQMMLIVTGVIVTGLSLGLRNR